MSVLLNTTAGDIVIDLFEDCPNATKNFLKLCKMKYYNGCLFYNVQPNLLVQTGDPTGTGKGGVSAYGLMYGEQANSFADEIVKTRKLNKVGMVCMAHFGGKENSNRSQFFITLRGEDLEHLEKTHTIFGEVAEGHEVLQILNSLYCDEENRPWQDVRIKHTYVLDDPYPDPAQLDIPPSSPEREIPKDELVKPRLEYEDAATAAANALDDRTEEELDQSIKRKEAKSRAIVLEMTGDIPDADVKPPVEVLFVCKLNAVTTDEDLELIFSRFGTIKSCEVIRDFKTGDSLNFAFIEFETEAACIEAYEKMNNVLIDDRRIKVDFSQSVSKLWNRFLVQPRSANSATNGTAPGAAAKKLGAYVGGPAKGANVPNSQYTRSNNNSQQQQSQYKPSHYGNGSGSSGTSARDDSSRTDNSRNDSYRGGGGGDRYSDKYAAPIKQEHSREVSVKQECSRHNDRHDNHRHRDSVRDNRGRDSKDYKVERDDRNRGEGRDRSRDRRDEKRRTSSRSRSRDRKDSKHNRGSSRDRHHHTNSHHSDKHVEIKRESDRDGGKDKYRSL